MAPSPAIADYDANAAALARQWRGVDRRQVLAPILRLLPTRPARVLDVGAGSGEGAAWLAGQGHAVLAVEPAAGLRRAGMAEHPSPRIEWLDDSLPDLAAVLARREAFDLVTLIAVWAHLDLEQRRRALPNLASLLAPGGRLVLSIRDGWTPPERPTWEARPEETIRLARAEGLALLLEETAESVQALNRARGVRWIWLAFERPA